MVENTELDPMESMEAGVLALLDSPRVKGALMHPDMAITLMLDTSDGKMGSEEDRRCDGCSKTQDELYLITWVFEPGDEILGTKLVFGPTSSDEAIPQVTSPSSVLRIFITLGACEACMDYLKVEIMQMNEGV